MKMESAIAPDVGKIFAIEWGRSCFGKKQCF